MDTMTEPSPVTLPKTPEDAAIARLEWDLDQATEILGPLRRIDTRLAKDLAGKIHTMLKTLDKLSGAGAGSED